MTVFGMEFPEWSAQQGASNGEVPFEGGRGSNQQLVKPVMVKKMGPGGQAAGMAPPGSMTVRGS